MKKMLELSKRAGADRNVANAPTKAERVLGTAELDKIAAAGGPSGGGYGSGGGSDSN